MERECLTDPLIPVHDVWKRRTLRHRMRLVRHLSMGKQQEAGHHNHEDDQACQKKQAAVRMECNGHMRTPFQLNNFRLGKAITHPQARVWITRRKTGKKNTLLFNYT